MAQDKSGANAPMTAAEMQQWIKDHEKQLKNYAAMLDPIKLRDVTKGVTRKVESLTKENIVEYLKKPVENEKKLRNAALYLYFRSQIFQRIIMYYATLFNFDARSVIPPYDLVKPPTDQAILKSYNDTLIMLNKWNINYEFLKVAVTCLLQDVSYNVAYYDKDGLFLLPLPPDYCKIYGQYVSGNLAFKMDMSYFRGTNQWLIEEWGEPFRTMWNDFQNGGGKWQVVPEKYSAAFKWHIENIDLIMPPFTGILGDLLALNEISDMAAVNDALDIYKLVYMKLKTITGAKMADEWSVSPGVSLEYASRLVDEALPPYVSFGVVPGDADLGVVDFSSIDRATETTKVQKAIKTVLNTSGGGQLLNATDVTGSTAQHLVAHVDESFSTSSMLPQFQAWINTALSYTVSNPSKVVFFHTGRLTKDEYRKELLENAQYSLPTKLSIMALSGIDPLETLSLNHLEEDILKLGDRFNDPLQSSYTSTSNDEGGRPTLDDDQISDSGEASRDKQETAG